MKGVITVYVAHNIMVCVTQQKTCERLIKKGAALKEELNCDLYVIHVAREGTDILGDKNEANALEYLFNISKGVGANLTVLKSKDVADAIVEYAGKKKIGHVILGEPPAGCREEGIISELRARLPFCKLYIVPVKELKR